jgi:hypothetical protein
MILRRVVDLSQIAGYRPTAFTFDKIGGIFKGVNLSKSFSLLVLQSFQSARAIFQQPSTKTDTYDTHAYSDLTNFLKLKRSHPRGRR